MGILSLVSCVIFLCCWHYVLKDKTGFKLMGFEATYSGSLRVLGGDRDGTAFCSAAQTLLSRKPCTTPRHPGETNLENVALPSRSMICKSRVEKWWDSAPSNCKTIHAWTWREDDIPSILTGEETFYLPVTWDSWYLTHTRARWVKFILISATDLRRISSEVFCASVRRCSGTQCVVEVRVGAVLLSELDLLTHDRTGYRWHSTLPSAERKCTLLTASACA